MNRLLFTVGIFFLCHTTSLLSEQMSFKVLNDLFPFSCESIEKGTFNPEISQNEKQTIQSALSLLLKLKNEKNEDTIKKGIDQIIRLGLPFQYGGKNLSFQATCELLQKASYHDSLSDYPLIASISILNTINLYATKEQKEWLFNQNKAPFFSISMTEENSGSKLDLQTTAEFSIEDQSYTIEGTKTFNTGGQNANYFLVFARIKEKGKKTELGIFIVPRSSKNIVFKQTKEWFVENCDLTGSVLHFNKVKVPKEYRLGDSKNSKTILFHGLNQDRILISFITQGKTEQLIKMSKKWTEERVIGTGKLKDFALTQRKMAIMYTQLFATQAILNTVSQWSSNEDLNLLYVPICMAKLLTTEIGQQIAIEVMQLFGGRGVESIESQEKRYDKTYLTGVHMASHSLSKIATGTSEILRLQIAKALFKEAKQGRSHSVNIFSFKNSKSKTETSNEFDKIEGSLARLCQKLEGIIYTYSKKEAQMLSEDQNGLVALANIATDLFVIGSSIEYAKFLVHKFPEQKLLVLNLLDQANHYFTSLIHQSFIEFEEPTKKLNLLGEEIYEYPLDFLFSSN